MSRTMARWLLLLTLLLGWGLRLWRLDDQELRGDEVFGYFFSLRPFDDMVQATVDLQEPHPVASYLVQQGWLGWAGHSEFALRFSSVWFGLLSVVLLWRLAQALTLSADTGLLAALLLAISPYAIWHSQDARMYSMSLALTTASSWLMIGWLQRQRRSWAIAYVVVSWLALHTHYFSVFVLAAQNLFVFTRLFLIPVVKTLIFSQEERLKSLLRLPARFTLTNWLILQATIAFFYGPWLLRVQTTLTNYHGNGDSPPLGDMLRRAGSVFLVGESVPADQRFWWALLAGGLLLWGLLTLLRAGTNGRRALTLLLVYLGVPLLATWWSALQRPIFNERYLVAAAPPFYLLLAVGLGQGGWLRGFAHRFQLVSNSQSALKRTGLGGVLAVGVWVGLLIGMGLSLGRHYGDSAYSKTRGWRTLATTLAQWSAGLPTAQVRIAQNFPDPTLWYYYQGDVAHVVLPPGAQDEAGARTTVQALRSAGVERVLLPLQPAPNWDERGIAAAVLATEYQLLYETLVGVWPVQLYVALPPHLTSVDVAFQNDVRLAGVATQPPNLTPGNVLAVQLNWQVQGAKLTGTEKVFVQLLNEAGQLVAQADRPLSLPAGQPTMPAPAFYGILLPITLSPGDYQLIAGLYDPVQPGAPRVLTTAGADHIVLKTMTVETR